MIIICLWFCGAASADNLQLVISGKAFHIGTDEFNENNYGFGFEYDFDERNGWVSLINAATLKDSNKKTSRYIGSGIKRRFRIRTGLSRVDFDAGLIALVMVRPDYNDDRPFFGAIPFVSLGNDWGGINLTYVPKVEEDTYPFWYLQFTLRLMAL